MNLFYYLHSHWDREWYLPFESYRLSLIGMVKNLINKIENHELNFFLLDGQTIILEDIQTIEPTLYQRLTALIKAKKIAIGPWYILGDQSLVCGESIIRNLDLGLKLCAQLGSQSNIGYCPDTFGHCADLPRILNLFGIQTAIVWRGVGFTNNKPYFIWQSKDKSQVLTYIFEHGYYNTLLQENETLTNLNKALFDFCENEDLTLTQSYIKELDGIFIPFGGDHSYLANKLKDKLDLLEMQNKNLNFVETLPDQFLNQLEESLDLNNVYQIQSELRSNEFAKQRKRAYLLTGVLSSRMYLKILNRQLENYIFNILEPLFFILYFNFGIEYPINLLNYLIKLLLQNQPHDSICGCSIDKVHREMVTRYDKALDLSLALKLQAISQVMNLININNKTKLWIQDRQVIDLDFKPKYITFINITPFVIQSPQLIKLALSDPNIHNCKNFQIVSCDKHYSLFTNEGLIPEFKDSYIIEAYIMPEHPIAQYATKSFKLPIYPDPKFSSTNQDIHNAIVSTNYLISNEFYQIKIDENKNIEVLDILANKSYILGHYFEDEVDGGDSYNFDPLPYVQKNQSELINYTNSISGNLVNSINLNYKINIYAGIKDFNLLDRSIEDPELRCIDTIMDKTLEHDINTTITLKKNTPIIFFETTFLNQSKDHRLSVVFKLKHTVTDSFAHNHFSLIKRQAYDPYESNSPVELATESTPDRYPNEKFFIVDNQIFFNKGLTEYGIYENLAKITLLRAVTRLSAKRLLSRGGGAGPPLILNEANCLFQHKLNYAWSSLTNLNDDQNINNDTNSFIIEAYEKANLFENSLIHCYVNKAINQPSLIDISNEFVIITGQQFSSINKNKSTFIIRFLNLSNTKQETFITVNFNIQSVTKVLLNDNIVEELSNRLNHNDSFQLKITFNPDELINLKFKV